MRRLRRATSFEYQKVCIEMVSKTGKGYITLQISRLGRGKDSRCRAVHLRGQFDTLEQSMNARRMKGESMAPPGDKFHEEEVV